MDDWQSRPCFEIRDFAASIVRSTMAPPASESEPVAVEAPPPTGSVTITPSLVTMNIDW